ncbi:MAG TPA: tyrosine--tRNA ligase [Candidatus Saccharibacteria bacterium]|nr:tyrosine--tRNA ligase [Candidatus Saccharibacteria bacterium]
MKLSEELKWRGFINQTTYDDISVLNDEPISFYIGVDPSSDSMTIGNLAAIMMVKCFIKHGHKAFLLVGGATGMIGDPDGKFDERNLKTVDEINKNKEAIASQYRIILDGDNFSLVDNYDWFKDINYLDFLRNIGKHVPMSQMLGRDFVQSRLGSEGSGISYAEFSYSLIQGYDFLHLFREFGVTLQLCGADQWGNSITGVDLIRRIESKEAHVYSTPLIINKSTGAKFGKSEDGAIWLDHNKTSTYKFFQFWLNADDAGVIDYLKVYTLLEKEKIDELDKELKNNPEARLAQKMLAREVTTLIHGKERTESVEKVTNVLFGGEKFESLSEADIEILSKEIPADITGKSVVEYLVLSNIALGNNDARRLISAGAVSINGQKITEDRIINERALVKKGKNSFVLVR